MTSRGGGDSSGEPLERRRMGRPEVRHPAGLLAAHRAAGRHFIAGEVRSFTLDEGEGVPVVFLHGMPTSSFLYRKLVPLLASEGYRALAFDFPGLGLAERPRRFDYSATALARFVGKAMDTLAVERCHLVVHDIGGVIGCEWAAGNPDRVLSLTILNTALNLSTYRDPWMFAWTRVPALRLAVPALLHPSIFAWLFYRHGGVSNRSAVSRVEVQAHLDLLKRDDGGRASIAINNGWVVPKKEAWLLDALRKRRYLAQVVWGDDDPVLGPKVRRFVESALGVEQSLALPAAHFLQEEQSPAIARAVADFAGSTPTVRVETLARPALGS